MTFATLPTELCLEILEKAISLPEFLNPDHLSEVKNPIFAGSNAKSNLIAQYWETERHRNALRRVCKLWDLLLRPLDHRYIDMKDIYHGTVPEDALWKGIRVTFTFCGYVSGGRSCTYCFPVGMDHRISNLIPTTQSASSSTSPTDPATSNTNPLRPLAAQIVTSPYRYLSPEELVAWCKYMPNVRVLIGLRVDEPNEATWKEAFNYLPQLRAIDASDSGTPIVQYSPFHTSNLTTLLYSGHDVFALSLDNSDLPSLRHLCLQGGRRGNGFRGDGLSKLTLLFERIGANLRSLEIGLHPCGITMPPSIWTLCPLLERLDTGMFLEHAPPPDHPLHIISTFLPGLYKLEGQPLAFVEPFSSSMSVIRWPSLKHVIVTRNGNLMNAPKQAMGWLRLCADACAENDVTLEVLNALSFGRR
jgi:hypothetical protein